MFLVPVSRRGASAADLRSASRALERFFDDTFDQAFGVQGATTAQTPALDLTEDDKFYTVTVNLPGVSKEDVKVSVEGKRVTLQAGSERKEDKKDGERVVYRERAVTSYSRSFTLPSEIDQAASAAKLEQGVLTLTLAKRNAAPTVQIAVN